MWGATYVEPEHDVAIGRKTRASCKLFVAGGVDNDGVVEGACLRIGDALAFVLSFTRYSSAPHDV